MNTATIGTKPRTARAPRQLVERPAPGKAPTAFRLWAFGSNIIDDGKTVVFSQRSADLLMAEQASRGRLYSFDFDHRSMMLESTPQAGKASGWHVLEVRANESGKPECWATACDWTAEARAGLEADPPEWRYFSPAYEVDPKTRELVSYVGCALTNNPLSHGIPALASAVTRSVSARATSLALVQLKALTARIAKLEKASAVRAKASAVRSTPRVTPRAERSRGTAPPRDFVLERIDRARRNALNNIK